MMIQRLHLLRMYYFLSPLVVDLNAAMMTPCPRYLLMHLLLLPLVVDSCVAKKILVFPPIVDRVVGHAADHVVDPHILPLPEEDLGCFVERQDKDQALVVVVHPNHNHCYVVEYRQGCLLGKNRRQDLDPVLALSYRHFASFREPTLPLRFQ
jgi:hypothetical protein